MSALISVHGLSKYYKLYAHDFDRVREIITGKPHHQKFYALHDINLEVREGQVVGLVGKNGAGKSTLLKLLANTMQPSEGSINIHGRVAALLELGASFHPEMSGHDNVYLNCAIQGLSTAETERVYADIVEFSGIGEFIHNPVKTYSSGMFVRLAFSIATHIDPDILIIDEALSVGDGAFSRRSFDRIMAFKKAGKTIFFCSHSLYQVEALCDHVLWIDEGRIRSAGAPAPVITAYGEFLRMESALPPGAEMQANQSANADEGAATGAAMRDGDLPRITAVRVAVDGHEAKTQRVMSGVSDVVIEIDFHPGRNLPTPSVALVFSGGDGRALASAGTLNDGLVLSPGADGLGHVRVRFPKLPLLKGNYNLDVYLLCERGLHAYEAALQAAELNVEQRGLAIGVVDLPHQWEV
ncbi:MAG: ABC transporter ATP-binding protein [Pseudomonadales bacterium]|jgi:lipopolysaccharide transport system ATP-binding protein|nr:ABC transporter ATP-binding protein [Pseudomonadales bacterium]